MEEIQTQQYRYWTGVGSRETPESVQELMRAISKLLTDMGWILRSGGAKGADTAFYEGCQQSEVWQVNKPYIYIGWNGMKGGNDEVPYWHDEAKGIYDATRFPTWEKAKSIAMGIHPAPEKLKRGGIALHTRNVFQVQGHSLIDLSNFLMCWAIPKGDTGEVKGGTATAVKLANSLGIRVVNLYKPEAYNEVVKFLTRHEVPHNFQLKEV